MRATAVVARQLDIHGGKIHDDMREAGGFDGELLHMRKLSASSEHDGRRRENIVPSFPLSVEHRHASSQQLAASAKRRQADKYFLLPCWRYFWLKAAAISRHYR